MSTSVLGDEATFIPEKKNAFVVSRLERWLSYLIMPICVDPKSANWEIHTKTKLFDINVEDLMAKSNEQNGRHLKSNTPLYHDNI